MSSPTVQTSKCPICDAPGTNCSLLSQHLAGIYNRRAVLPRRTLGLACSAFRSVLCSISQLRRSPSSSPIEIYRGLRKDISGGDRDSAKTRANRAGILRGVEAKRANGIIDDEASAEIGSIVKASGIQAFRPVCYVIPFCLVQNRVQPAPTGQRAHLFSAEFIIETLPRDCFDAIGLEGI